VTRLAVIGAGVMGEAVFSQLVRAGWSAADIVVSDPRADRCAQLVEQYGVSSAGNTDAAASADLVLLAVKPQDIGAVLDEIADSVQSGSVVASIAAGTTTRAIEDHLRPGTPVVRISPNTPAQIGQGMAAVSAGTHATDEQVARVAELMAVTGGVITVPESYQDAVTATAGSGPAYVFLVLEALIESGVHLGLPRPTATELATQTLFGSAALAHESGDHPALLRERVTSPAGTTAAALRVLEDHKLRAAFLAATAAARDRARQLAEDAGKQARP
jgi:pyrroline-5-carboxylate reductase